MPRGRPPRVAEFSEASPGRLRSCGPTPWAVMARRPATPTNSPAFWSPLPEVSRSQNSTSLWDTSLAGGFGLPGTAGQTIERPSVGLPPEETSVTTPTVPQGSSTKPSLPSYGPGDVLLPPPEPAPPPPPKDFRMWLRDVLSDENVRYYAGPHVYDALLKLHALTQLLPGSGTVQSTQDASLAGEEAKAGNYGKAAAHFALGTVNAALDWLPPAKLAIIDISLEQAARRNEDGGGGEIGRWNLARGRVGAGGGRAVDLRNAGEGISGQPECGQANSVETVHSQIGSRSWASAQSKSRRARLTWPETG